MHFYGAMPTALDLTVQYKNMTSVIMRLDKDGSYATNENIFMNENTYVRKEFLSKRVL